MTTSFAARTQDQTLVALVDSLVEAIDANRPEAVDRVREALEPFGAVSLFDDELRLNGISSADFDCECICEGWL